MKKANLKIKRTKLRKEQNRKSILEAAEKIFSAKNYNLARVDDIAEEAQFSKATLYKYFPSKKEIFLQIILSSFEEAEKKMMKIFEKKSKAEKKLRELIYFVSLSSRKKKIIARLFLMDKETVKKILSDPKEKKGVSNQHFHIPYKFKIKIRKIYDIVCEIIKEGIESGEFRKMDVKDAANIFGAMVRGFYIRGAFRNKEYGINESTDLLHSFFLSGIKRTEKVEKGA